MRCEVVDASGLLDVTSTAAISFRVDKGEGRLWATHSGDPAADAYESPHAHTRTAYHGLARAIGTAARDANP